MLLIGLLVPMMGGAGLLVVDFTERLLLEEMKDRGMSVLSALSVPCSISLASHEIERLDDFLAQFRSDSPPEQPNPSDKSSKKDQTLVAPIRDLVFLCIVDNHGRVLAHTNETEYGSIRTDDFTTRAMASEVPLALRKSGFSDSAHMAISYPVKSGLRWGTLVAEFSLSRLQSRTLHLRWKLMALTLILITLVIVGLALGLGRLVVRPVSALSSAAQRLGDGDLDARVSVKSPHDELGILANVFNTTASELAAYTRDLEEKIRQRSVQILEKNEELQQANKRLSMANKRLEEVATTDGLTGLANKTHFLSRLSFEFMRAERGGHKLSLMMMDIDHFKNFNDTNGHLAGDALLRQFAKLISENMRSIDLIGRFGGEEFCVAMLDTGIRHALKAAEKIRKAIERYHFEGEESQPGGKLTVSIGVAEFSEKFSSDKDLIQSADEALYRAKNLGRNRVEGS